MCFIKSGFSFFVAVFLSYNQYWPGGFMVLWFLCPGAPDGSPAVVLVLKRLRRRGHDLKSHPIDWEKPGIEASTPGLQDIGLSPTPWCIFHFCKLDNLIELLLLDVMCCYGIKFLPV